MRPPRRAGLFLVPWRVRATTAAAWRADNPGGGEHRRPTIPHRKRFPVRGAARKERVMAYSSKGKVEPYYFGSDGSHCLLYDFSIGAGFLKPAHRSYLDLVVDQFKGQSIYYYIIGFASRSGNFDINLQVSTNRALAVRKYLLDRGFPYPV